MNDMIPDNWSIISLFSHMIQNSIRNQNEMTINVTDPFNSILYSY